MRPPELGESADSRVRVVCRLEFTGVQDGGRPVVAHDSGHRDAFIRQVQGGKARQRRFLTKPHGVGIGLEYAGGYARNLINLFKIIV